MAPELRKRKAPAPAPEPAPKKTSKVSKAVAKVKQAVVGEPEKSEEASAPAAPAAAAAKTGAPTVGDIISLEGFGGEIETHEGKKTTLKALVDESKSGVVLFTYPKASTPGCKLFSSLYLPIPEVISIILQFGTYRHDLTPKQQALPRSACSVTVTNPSLLVVLPSMVSPRTRAKPIQHSRRSRTCLTLCFAIQARP